MGLGKNNTGLEEIKNSVSNIENLTEDIKSDIGNTDDTSATVTSGSVMAKLNEIVKIISRLGVDENGMYVIVD